jgi:DNA-binding CsgD family transcriptional regulator/tetratricopeptide (TPR) repeat protein
VERTELLEREPFLAALRTSPTGRVVLIAGEAGIGKTALVRAFAAEAEESGRRVLWGAADALSTPRPLGPLHDIARQAGGALSAVMAAESSRQAMFGTFLDELTARGCVVVIEDAHWADQPTLDLLLFTARRIAMTTCLLVVTYRDDEVGPDHPLLTVLGTLATDRNVTRIELPPLSAEAVAALAEPLGVPAGELHARTGGNPFYVTEVLADPGRRVPATVRDAVLARTSGLRPDERSALSAVSIFPDGALLAVVQAAPDAVDGCIAAGMLVADGSRVRFRHELARLAILAGIPPGRRVALHAQALVDLSRRSADPALLAFHAQESDDGPAVLRHAPVAARRAAAVGANHQVVDHLAQSLRFADTLTERERAELLEPYAEACSHLDRGADAVAAAAEALSCWRSVGDVERETSLLARRADYLWRVGDTVGAQATTDAAVALAESRPPGPSLAIACSRSATVCMLTRQVPRAIDVGLRAIDLAERYGELTALARALNAVGSAYWFQESDRAEGYLLRSIEVGRQIGDDAVVAAAMVNLGSGAGEIRRYETAEHWLRQAVDFSSTRQLDRMFGYAMAWLGRCLFEQGRWDDAATVLEQVSPTSGAPTRIVALTALGRLRARRGDPGAANALDQAWVLAEATGDLQRLWPAAAGRAEIAWYDGHPTDPLVRETYQLGVELAHGWSVGELGQWLVQPPSLSAELAAVVPSAYRLGPREAAARWDEIGAPYEAAMALAGAALGTADPDDLREALSRLERLGARPAANLVSRRMRDLGIRPARRSTLAHPDGLTAREVDVLDLVAKGLRNAEIAVELSIAEKTVDHHVSSILAKLGVPTRREAAAYARAGSRGDREGPRPR